MVLLENIVRARVDQAATRTSHFLKIDLVNDVMANKDVAALFAWIASGPKKFDVRGYMQGVIEQMVGRELQRHDNNGWRVFESYSDPQSRYGKNRLFMPLRFMNFNQLDSARKQAKRERGELVRKEERMDILCEIVKAAGPRAVAGDHMDEAAAEVARRRAARA